MKRLLLAALLVFPCALSAQPSDCSDGAVIYDDGVFESGLGFNEANVTRGAYGMRFIPPTAPLQLTSVCMCLARSGSDSSLSFNLNVWDVAANGAPGTLLGRVTGLAANSVASGLPGNWHRFDLSGAGIVVNGPVFIGPDWNAKADVDFFICEDRGVAPAVPTYLYASATDTPGVPNLNVLLGDGLYEALGIRAKFETPTSGCVPGPNRLCLNQGRFAVEATFTAPGQPPGTASVVKLTDETGYLWFFNSSNVEAVVKVLNACGLNQRFWVFAGGLTDVQVTLTVTDTQTGNSKTYTNPQGTAFRPIQDTAALPCQ